MSIERVREYLSRFGADEKIIELTESSATVELAAAALGTEPQRIAKSLSFLVGDKAVLVVCAGDTKVDNAKFKAFFGVKAKMLTPEQAVTMIGHAVGGVCPFGIEPDVKVYLDESMRRFETVFPAAGSSNSCIELTLAELEEYSKAECWVDVCKLK